MKSSTSIAGEPNAQMSTGLYMGRMLDRIIPPIVLAGPDYSTPDGRLRLKRQGEDQALLEKTAHVRRPKETMMEFFARVGLGAAQIRTMNKEEISRFVEVATKQEIEAGPTTWVPLAPKVVPSRFVMVGD